MKWKVWRKSGHALFEVTI